MNRFRLLLFPVLLIALVVTAIASANDIYLPIVRHDKTPTPSPTSTPTPTQTPTPTITPTPSATPDPNAMVEVRGMWVSRFDWTNGRDPADPAKIDEIINNAALAGFNMIFFQVRGTGDAFYTPGLEPWSQRVSGQFEGQWPSPFWDPLAYFIDKAHANGIQLHAYLNVYPISHCTNLPNVNAFPLPIYHQLRNEYGTTEIEDGEGNAVTFLNGLQWLKNHDSQCLGSYLRASPASLSYDNHLIAIGQDLIARYDIDGLHLDHIRYAGRNTSCDPVSQCRYAGQEENCDPVPDCDLTNDFKDWQRRQVSGTVRKFYQQVIEPNPTVWFSAAVWPVHQDKWGWGSSQGYFDYYQDSKAWAVGGYIDSISPMIYSNVSSGCPEDSSFWTRNRWETLVWDFQAASGERNVIPGIGSSYCDFAEIEWRINKAREVGTIGHALFSYSHLRVRGWFDDLANGPYQEAAVVPPISWRDQ